MTATALSDLAVGDKVKVTRCSDNPSYEGQTATVIQLVPGRYRHEIQVRWDTAPEFAYLDTYWVNEVEKITAPAAARPFAVGDKVKVDLCSDVRCMHGETGEIINIVTGSPQPYCIRPDRHVPGWGSSSVYVEQVSFVTPPDTASELAEFKAKLWKLGQRMKEERGYGAQIDEVFAELGVTAPTSIIPEPTENGTVVSFGSVIGQNVFRKLDVLSNRWEMTGTDRSYTWDEIVAFSKSGSGDLQLVWKPGMTLTKIEETFA